MDQSHKSYICRVCHCGSSQAESSKLKLNVLPCIWSPGDEILDVNGIPIKGLTFQEAIHTFKVTVSPWVSFVLFLFFPSTPPGFAYLPEEQPDYLHPPSCLAANPERVVCPHSAHEVTQPQPHAMLHAHAHEQVQLPKLQHRWGDPRRRRQ